MQSELYILVQYAYPFYISVTLIRRPTNEFESFLFSVSSSKGIYIFLAC